MPTRTPESLGLTSGDVEMRDGVVQRVGANKTAVAYPVDDSSLIYGFEHLSQQSATIPIQNLPSQSKLTTSHKDRADGFVKIVSLLSITVGVLGVLLGVVVWKAPWVGGAALAWFMGGFCLTWLLAFIVHTMIGPDGVSWMIALIDGVRSLRQLDYSYDLIDKQAAHRRKMTERQIPIRGVGDGKQ